MLRIAIAALALLIAVSARAQDAPTVSYERATAGTGTVNIITAPACVDQFKNLPALAERLGVKPWKGGNGTIVLRMCDGRMYDFVDLLSSFIDRMEKDAR